MANRGRAIDVDGVFGEKSRSVALGFQIDKAASVGLAPTASSDRPPGRVSLDHVTVVVAQDHERAQSHVRRAGLPESITVVVTSSPLPCAPILTGPNAWAPI